MKRILRRNNKAWLLLTLVMMLILVGCGNAQTETEMQTLNIGLPNTGIEGSGFRGIFSPFYTETVTDHNVVDITQLQLLPSDRAGAPVLQGIEGETRSYNGADYTYYGPADLTMTQNPDGTVYYDIILRDNLTFSDGEPVTVDDLIFSIYVLCDPAYNGPSRLGEMPIQGLEAYRADYISLAALLFQLGENNGDFTLVTPEEQSAFWAAVDGGLTEFIQMLLDQEQAEWDASMIPGEDRTVVTPAYFAEMMGWEGLPEDATARDLGILMAEQYDWDFVRLWGWICNSSFFGIASLPELLGEVYGYSSKFVFAGDTEVCQIAGIQRTGEYTLRLVADQVEVSLLYALAEVYVAPLHYYGDAEAFDYDKNSFGFSKGDLSGVRARDEQPLGAGPYRLVSYENGIVTCQANEQYYLGAPKIPQLRLSCPQVLTEAINNEVVDICIFSSGYFFDKLEGVTVLPITSQQDTSYLYIGLNPRLINVDGKPGSEASKNLRKGFATVIAACRQLGLNQERELNGANNAALLDVPISRNTWLVSGPKDPIYREAYSWDKNGKSIFTEDMSEEERLDAALQAALGYFEAAGCTVENGEVTAPTGARFRYEMTFWGGENSAQLLAMREASAALARIGVELTVTFISWEELQQISDQDWLAPEEQAFYCSNWSGPDMAGREKGDMLCAEWYLVADPDAWLYPIYYSDVLAGGVNPGVANSKCGISDPELDQLLIEARSTVDQTERAKLYAQCLECIWDWACEVPFFQSHGNLVYRSEIVNSDTLPGDMTAYYGWQQEVHNLALNEVKSQ